MEIVLSRESLVKIKSIKPEYLEKAQALTIKKAERLMSRMSFKLQTQLAKDGWTAMQIMAVQLEIEDEQLHEWRERIAQVRLRDQQHLAQTGAVLSTAVN